MAVLPILLTVIVGAISYLVYLVYSVKNYWKSKGVPFINPKIPQGNLDLEKDEPIFMAYRKVYNAFKGKSPIAGFYLFMKPTALIIDLNLIKNILIKDFSNFADRNLFCNEEDDPLTGHLFLLGEDKWRTLRHKLSPTFTSGKMKSMFPTVVNVCRQFTDVFSEIAKSDNSIVEIKDLLARYTTDVIGTCAFGIDCNSLKDPNAEFRKKGKQIFTDHRHHMVIMGLIYSFPKWAKKLHMKVIPQYLTDFFMGVVKETIEFREKNNVQKNDFMNLLIELKNNKETSLTIEEIAAQCFVFFGAGFETSSSTMAFCLYELALNQDIQDKLRNEVIVTLEKHNGELTYECVRDMSYLEQVVNGGLNFRFHIN